MEEVLNVQVLHSGPFPRKTIDGRARRCLVHSLAVHLPWRTQWIRKRRKSSEYDIYVIYMYHFADMPYGYLNRNIDLQSCVRLYPEYGDTVLLVLRQVFPK